jgi:hypothetical protein
MSPMAYCCLASLESRAVIFRKASTIDPPNPENRSNIAGFAGRALPDSVVGYHRIRWSDDIGFSGRALPD